MCVISLSFRASARREASALGVHTGVGIRNPRPLPLPLGEVAERSEDGEGKQRRAASRRPFFQLVDKPSLWGQRFIYAGGARGGKARLESDQMSRKALPCKACVEHPKGTCFAARRDYFRAARRHKNNDIIQAVEKSRRLFRQPEESRPSGRLSCCHFMPRTTPWPGRARHRSPPASAGSSRTKTGRCRTAPGWPGSRCSECPSPGTVFCAGSGSRRR